MLIPQLPPNFAAALRDTQSAKPALRIIAAQRLAKASEVEAESAVTALSMLVDDPDPRVREAAVEALGFVGNDSIVPTLRQCAADPSPRVREVAVIALGAVGGVGAEEVLEATLDSEHPEVRFQAVYSFAELAPERATEAVGPLLADVDPEVRMHAAMALGAARATGAGELLAKQLNDPDRRVRLEAALSLAQLSDARGTTLLIEALGDPERSMAAALALGDLRADAARGALTRLATGFFVSRFMRAASAGALAGLGDEGGVEALRTLLTGFRGDVRGFAAELVGRYGVRELVPEVIGLMKRPRGADTSVVVRALHRLARGSDPEPRAQAALDAAQRAGGTLAEAVADALDEEAISPNNGP